MIEKNYGNRRQRGGILWVMIKSVAGGLMLVVALASCGRPRSTQPPLLTLCELSRDLGAYRDKLIAVRGVYYDGLRETCPAKCATGPWPSFICLTGTSSASRNDSARFITDTASWDALDSVEQTVKLEATKGNRLEIRVTAVGQLRTMAKPSPLGPCDKISSGYFGYGHLGEWPAELVIKYFSDIEVKANPNSPYDYGKMYHCAL